MKNIIKLEELAMLALSIYALYYFQADWWWYLLLVFGPDISMIGYVGGNTIGALTYNLVHHKAVAICIFIAGIVMNEFYLQLTGIILFGHSSMDRVFGYGLKLKDGFKHTHLGVIGQNSSTYKQ